MEAVEEGEALEYLSQSEIKVRGRRVRIVRDVREACATIQDGEAVAWDLETGGLDPWRAPIAVVSLYGERSKTPIVLHIRGHVTDDLRRLMSSKRLWVGHNTTCFDRLFAEVNGIDTFGEGVEHYDTMVGEGCARVSGRHDVRVNLKATLARRIGRKITKDADHNSWMNPELDADQLLYCVDDVMGLLGVRIAQLKKVADEGRAGVIPFEQSVCNVTTAMILTGVPLDRTALEAWHERSRKDMAKAEVNLRHAVGEGVPLLSDVLGLPLKARRGAFNLGSPQQVKKLVAERFDYVLSDCQKPTLQAIADQDAGPISDFCRDLLLWKPGQKRTSMYDEDWLTQYVQADGRVHGRFWQTGTDTLRFSGTDPNLQQWPRNGRGVFGGEAGMSVVSADYDAIEVMILAGLAGDRQLLQDCLGDPHANLASFMTGLSVDDLTLPENKEKRRLAKAANFTMGFCGGFNRFFESVRLGNREMTTYEARQYFDGYLRRYPEVDRMRNRAYAMQGRQQVVLNLPMGHRRQLVGTEVTATRIVNNLVQGTAAVGMKNGLVKLDKARLVRGYLGSVVHDEALACAPTRAAEEYAAELERCMVEGMLEVIPSIPCRAKPKIASHWS